MQRMTSAFLALGRISRHNPRKVSFHDQQKPEAGKRQILSKPEFKTRTLQEGTASSYLRTVGSQEAGSAKNETFVRPETPVPSQDRKAVSGNHHHR
jgi:hypothetical protein